MSGLISRKAAIDAIDKYSVWVIYNDGMDDAELVESIIKQTKEAIKSLLIHDLPSAQPEIRCKDCKHSEYDVLYGDRWCHHNGKADIVPDGHYCGYAERGENATN